MQYNYEDVIARTHDPALFGQDDEGELGNIEAYHHSLWHDGKDDEETRVYVTV